MQLILNKSAEYLTKMYIADHFYYLTIDRSALFFKIKIVLNDKIDRIILQLNDVIQERLNLFFV